MSDRLLRLAQRIRTECPELARLVERAQEGWGRAQRSSDDLYVDSVALNLHSFYAGLERLFEMIGAAVDGNVPLPYPTSHVCRPCWSKLKSTACAPRASSFSAMTCFLSNGQ